MQIYKKRFQLRDGLSLSQYIQKLNDTAFPPYVLVVEKAFGDKKYSVRSIFMTQPLQWGVILFPGGMLINKCAIQFSDDKKEFTLTGSIRGLNLIMGLLSVVPSLLFFSFAVFYMITKELLIDNFLVFMVMTFVVLVPLTSTFSREKKLLDLIGSFGS